MDASEGEIQRNLTAINNPYIEKRCWACRSLAEMVEDENSRIFCDAQCWQQYYTLAQNQLTKKNKPVKPPKPKFGGITKPSKLKKTTKPPVKVPEKPPIKVPEKPKVLTPPPQPEKPLVKAPEKPKAVQVPKKKPFNKAPKKPKVVTPPPVKVPEKQPSPPIKEPEKPVVAKQEASNTSASESASSRKLKKPLPYQRKGRRSQRRSKNPLPSYFGDEQKKKAKQSADGSQSKGSESTTKDKQKEPSGGSPPVVAKDPTKKKDKKPSDGSQSKDPAKKDKSKKKPSPSDASDPAKKDKSKPSDASESKDPNKKKKKDKQEPVVKPDEPTREQRLQDKYDRAKGRRKDAEQRAQEERESRIRAEAAAEAAAQRDNGGGASGGGFYLPDNSDRSYTLPNGGGGGVVPINPVPVVTRRTEIVQDDRRVTPQPPPFTLPEPRRKPRDDDAGTVITEQVGDDDGKMRETIIEDPVVPVRPRNDIITRKPSKSIDKTRRMKKNNRYSEFGVRDEEYWKQPNGFGYGLWWHRRYPWISRYVSFAKFFPQKWRPYYILSDEQNIATYEYGDPIDQENVLIDEDLFAGAIVPPLATFAQLGVDSEILHMPAPYRNKLRTEERNSIRAALRLIECEILRMRADIDLLSYSYQGYTPVPDFDRESMVWVKRV